MAFRRGTQQTEIGKAFAPRSTAAAEIWGEGYAEPGESGLDLILGTAGAVVGGIYGGVEGAAAGWQMGAATGDLVTGLVPGHEKYAKTPGEAAGLVGSSVGQIAEATPAMSAAVKKPATASGGRTTSLGTPGSADISPGQFKMQPGLTPLAPVNPLGATPPTTAGAPELSTAALGATTEEEEGDPVPYAWAEPQQQLVVAQYFQKQRAAAQQRNPIVAPRIAGLAAAQGAPTPTWSGDRWGHSGRA